jgi:hypothetical protein
MRTVFLFLLSVYVLCVGGCHRKQKQQRFIVPGFYYWKTNYKLNDLEKAQLDSLKTKTLYIRFFDIEWDENLKKELPAGQIQFSENPDTSLTVIPAVFITNESVRQLSAAAIPKLADNIISLVEKTCSSFSINKVPEVQIDCDWTAGTKENYFYLLNEIKKHSFLKNKKLSVTIRLYQLKYADKTGIPPADKGLLMCYNMGNLKNSATDNSIIETAELKKYINSLSIYPLQMDIALPLFEWKVLFRNNNYAGLIQNLPDDSLKNNSSVKQSGNRYSFTRETSVAGYSFLAGDMLRDEKSNYDEVLAAAKEIAGHLKNTRPRVVFYHLDSVILKKYTSHELQTVFNCFR